MAKTTSSGWDFGELFPAGALRRVLTVSELTSRVRRQLEAQFSQVWVTGEITNFRLQASGHAYFTLKDATAQLACVLFRGVGVEDRALLEDGLKVVLGGDLTVYEPRGQHQLVVRNLELQGQGALQVAFERLKRKLQAEGCFAQERKRPLPRFPSRVGVVTSPTGAALRDVIHVLNRRYAGIELVLAPCRVQGAGAAAEIAAAVAALNAWARQDVEQAGQGLDLILVTRGGGSLEDLWAFNEEAVARAILESALPVVSAVGHEIDVTISDLVADVRAATPSAAAEILTEAYVAARPAVAESWERIDHLVRRRIASAARDLDRDRGRLERAHPRRQINRQAQQLDEAVARLARAGRRQATAWGVRNQQALRRLRHLRLQRHLVRWHELCQDLQARLRQSTAAHLKAAQNRWATADARLRSLCPDRVLARGYSLTFDAVTGRILRSSAGVEVGRKLLTRLPDGALESQVSGRRD